MITKILFDTDFLIALFLKSESTHKKAKQLYTKCKKGGGIINVTKFELATVLSRKLEHQKTKQIISTLNKSALNEIGFNVSDERTIWKKFHLSIALIYRLLKG